ncbi:hypothetical protein KAH94_03395 [bacterium]|nr:hypothetical protein [bacterium]
MNTKKKLHFCLIPVLSLSVLFSLQAMEFEDDFDRFLDDPEVTNFLDENEFDFALKEFTPEDTLDLLKDINFIDIVQEDIFLRTQPLTKRNILDLPIARLNKSYEYDNVIMGAELFWNNTDRSFFSQKCDNIAAYLALTQDSLLQKLKVPLEAFEGQFEFDPIENLLLFKNGTIQERRFGVLLHGRKPFWGFIFTWKIPLYWLESNYWFTNKEQEEIEKAFGKLEDKEQEQFQERYMISDKFGFGDLRLKLDYDIDTKSDYDVRLGGFITIPCAWALSKGLKGTHFTSSSRNPNQTLNDIIGVSLNDILTMVLPDEDEGEVNQSEEAFLLLRDFTYGVLDNMSANLLDTPLGNGHHFGVGVHTETLLPLSIFFNGDWAEKVIYKGAINLEYLFPSSERRFFTEYNDERLFNMRDFDDESKAKENLDFLEQQLINKLMPFSYQTKVWPGIVFKWTGCFTYEAPRWGIHIGTDMWIKSKEKICDIESSCQIADRLKIEKARRLMGYQSKVLGSIFYKARRDDRNWIISLNGDYTWWKSGIGSDYTLSFNLEVDF